MNKKLFFFELIVFITIALWPSQVINNIQVGRNFYVDKMQNIYTHYDSYSIIKYSPEGKQLLLIGRKGEGPGDIKRIGWFAINPKDSKLYVTEIANGNRRISIFSPLDGKYIDNWKFDFNWNEWEGIPNIQFDNMGNVYIEAVKSVWRPYKSFQIGALEKVIIKYSPSGEKLKEFYRLKSDFMAEKPGKGNITIPFCNYLAWNVYMDFVVIRENSNAYINVFNLDGQPIKEIKLPFDKIKVTSKDLDEWEKTILSDPVFRDGVKQGWFDLKFWRKNLPFPKYKSISGYRMFFDSKGFLYNYKYSKDRKKDNNWIKLDISTEKKSTINFPAHDRLLCINNGYFYFATKNEDDEVLVVKKIEETLVTDKDTGKNER